MPATIVRFFSIFLTATSLVLLSGVLSLAQAKTFELPVQEGDRLILKGLAAQVVLTAQPGATQIRVGGLDETAAPGHFMMYRREHTIEIRMTEFETKADWREAMGKISNFQKKIEIVGPALPLEVHLRDGSVVLQKWTKEARINLVTGRVSSQSGAGALQVSVQKGDINITDQNGRVSTDSFGGNTSIKDIQGDTEAQSFSGNLTIEKVRGFLSLNAQQATVKVNQSSGSMQFENGKGPFIVQGFQGRIEGQTGEGNLNIGFLPDSEISLKSKSGRIIIQAPANSGASLNLLTVDGEITVPKELRVNRLTGEKSVRGHLRGGEQKATILVRSQDGSIVVK